jgi:hypothetical protein
MGYRILDCDHHNCTKRRGFLPYTRDAHGGARTKSPRYDPQQVQPFHDDNILYKVQSQRITRNERTNVLHVEPRRLQYDQSEYPAEELSLRYRVQLLSGRSSVTPAKALPGLGSIATQLITRSTPTRGLSQGW